MTCHYFVVKENRKSPSITTKGGLVYPTLFNVAVDNFVRNCLFAESGGQISSPYQTGTCGGPEFGRFLRGRCTPGMLGTVVASGCPGCPHRTISDNQTGG